MDNLPRYATLDTTALRWIIKDAGEARANMIAIGDRIAEAKYSDQINDAYTTIARREEAATAAAAAKAAKPKAAKRPAVRDWQCMECGKAMTLAQAERATSVGCSKCGGADIDLKVR